METSQAAQILPSASSQVAQPQVALSPLLPPSAVHSGSLTNNQNAQWLSGLGEPLSFVP